MKPWDLERELLELARQTADTSLSLSQRYTDMAKAAGQLTSMWRSEKAKHTEANQTLRTELQGLLPLAQDKGVFCHSCNSYTPHTCNHCKGR